MITRTEQIALNIVDASIDQLSEALSTGIIGSVELAAAYLYRISAYDCRGPALNSIPILNPRIFEEAQASDERRARGASLGPLDGIPFTIKDSYKVKGQYVANGSPAFQDLVANEDAFVVQNLRKAGAILIGRTNMCPMAAGGMQRGVYGRAESPYNSKYLAAAFASGSSNGSGVSTAASFAAFGLGSETVSSGRSPASNNALVTYTPTQGAISLRGIWPLYPTCDVMIPHARSMKDLLTVLDVVVVEDSVTHGDFWRDQDFIKLPNPWINRPKSLRQLADQDSLSGLRIAVPTTYVNSEQSHGNSHIRVSSEVMSLYRRAKSDLENLGATVIEVPDLPVVTQYELANVSPAQVPASCRLPKGWHMTERSITIAYAWEQFLNANGDYNITSLMDIDAKQIFPLPPPDDPQLRYTELPNRIHYEKVQQYVKSATSAQIRRSLDARSVLMSIDMLQDAIKALESIRKVFFDDWLAKSSFDAVIFPACGDVGRADADVSYEAAEHAWTDGVKYSNGNRAIRHLGIPTVTVPMGNMAENGMPVGLTFLGKAGDDMKLLQWASAYEKISRRREPPKRTPELGIDKDMFTDNRLCYSLKKARPELKIESCTTVPTSRNGIRINVEGFITCATSDTPEDPELEIIIDGQHVPKEKISVQRCQGTLCGRHVYDFRCTVVVSEPPKQEVKNTVASRRRIARDSTMVVVLAREGGYGTRSGYLKLL